MSIRKLRAGRVPSVTASQYVGERGTIFWNEATGTLLLSDGATLGGHPLNQTPATAIYAGGVKPGDGLAVESDGTLYIDYGPEFYFDNNKLRLYAATSTQFGGIKLGPGVITNSQGQIIIDSAGLDFSFGDFAAFTNTGAHDGACLSSVNVNQDVNIVSNGTGTVNIVGEFNVHTTDSDVEGALSVDPVFRVAQDGQVHLLVKQLDNNAGALEIVGSQTGGIVAPGLTGTMLHITGQLAQPARTYIDGNGGYVSLVGRRWNGSILNGRTQVLVGDDVLRINATAQHDTDMPSVSFAQIRMTALENQTTTAQGSSMTFTVTPIGSTASNRVDVATITVANGLTATKFTGPLTGNVTGTVTDGVVTTGSYANPTWITSLAASKVSLGNVENTALSTSTHYIGTTSIQYSRASAAQTLSGVSISGNAGTVTNGVYTTDTGTVSNTMLAGSIANNKLANSAITINGTSIALGASATVTAAAGTLTGTSLNSTVVTSSLTSVGTLTTGTVGAGFTAIANARLANSTISGTALGNNLPALTMGFGLTNTSYDGTSAVTINNYYAVTTGTVSANAATLDLATSTGMVLYNNGNNNWILTIANTTVIPGKIVRVFVAGLNSGRHVNLVGPTAAQTSNGTLQFNPIAAGGGNTMIFTFHCTTNALSGVVVSVVGGA